MHQPPPLPPELAKTRRFKPDAVTTPFVRVTDDAPFVRVTDDATVRFSRPYERIELDLAEKPVERVELDLSRVKPIDDDTLPFALESSPIERVEPSRESAPYDLIEMRISVPAIAEPLRTAPVPQRAGIRPSIVITVAVVLISAFASGVGIVYAL